MISKRTKIVCTLGPASRSLETIEGLVHAGMDVARLNFSHGSHDDHARTIADLRAVSEKLDRRVTILQDLSGPKMRIGKFAEGSVELESAHKFVLTTRRVPGDRDAVSINCPELIEAAKPSDRILLGDGILELQVVSAGETDIVCEVVVGGTLGSNKGISAPGVDFKGTVPTEKDLTDLAFGLARGVDWVAQSFVRTADEVRSLRSAIRGHGSDVPVIVKLEKREAMDNLDAIIAEADAVMVARGDLGLEIGLHEIPFAQKAIIKAAGRAGKPEITATQMLESMITNPRPTRAEVTDIANAIIDGSDAIMLSGETAVGKYPVTACQTMARIAATTEAKIDYIAGFQGQRIQRGGGIDEAIAHAAAQTALEIDAVVIICCTRSGQTARLIAKYRPQATIAVVSPYENTLRRTQLLWGTYPIKIELNEDTDKMIDAAKQAVRASKLALPGDRIVIVAGIPPDESGTTNMLKADML